MSEDTLSDMARRAVYIARERLGMDTDDDEDVGGDEPEADRVWFGQDVPPRRPDYSLLGTRER
jgi:hypothetical protein